jgi:hypothetical protein
LAYDEREPPPRLQHVFGFDEKSLHVGAVAPIAHFEDQLQATFLTIITAGTRTAVAAVAAVAVTAAAAVDLALAADTAAAAGWALSHG